MKSELIDQRQQKQKELLIEQLKKMPIIQVACEKISVGRATYYRWMKEDADFKEQASEAIEIGVKLMNDFAESQLITAIKNSNLPAITFWLRHRHKAYTQRVEVTTKKEDLELNDEQQKAVEQALEFGGLLKKKKANKKINK
ncbi:MAG: phBC6A51 family helix-turn-helix protein [Patescibacteria group bacterium]|jgi:hypothetical protein